MSIVRDIYLYGDLAEKFGEHFRLAVETPAEAVRALDTLRPGFAQHVWDQVEKHGMGYNCFAATRSWR